MTSLRSRIAALSIVISLMTSAASAAFAPAVRHACPADQHACCHTARLMACCPGDDETPGTSSTPAASRMTVDPQAVALAVLPVVTSAPDARFFGRRDVPNRSPGPDLTTLLGTFRI